MSETLPVQSKVCSRCKDRKTLAEFYPQKDKPFGRCSRCKQCMREVSAERYAADPDSFHRSSMAWQKRNPEKVAVIRRRTLEKNAEKIRRVRREVYEPRRREQRKVYRAANQDRIRQKNAEYRERKTAERKAYNARYYAEHKEQVAARIKKCTAAKPDLYREIHSKWKRENVDACRAMAHKRYARKKGNGGKFTAAEWAEIKKRYGYGCLMCGQCEPEIILTIDHIIPIEKRGPNVASNIQPLCKSCNSKKGTRILDLRPDKEIYNASAQSDSQERAA